MQNKNIISDDILDNVSGGYYTGGKDDAQANGKCPHCATLLKKAGKYYKCTECGCVFDKYGNEIGGSDCVHYD